jgi:hypothetical protein
MVRVEGFEPSISCSQSRRIKPDFPTLGYLEEDVRFELTDLLQPLVFKTSAIDHSANPPYCLVVDIGYDPIRYSPSDHSPKFIKLGRTPVLSTTVVPQVGLEPTDSDF